MTIAEQILQAKTDIDEVYTKGVEDGKAQGGNTEEAYQNGYTDGKQAEYDTFWDNFQQNGKRTSYGYTGFNEWNKNILKPKYDIKPTGGANSLFRAIKDIDDLDAHLNECGVKFIATNITSFNDAFTSSGFKYIGVLDLSSCSTANFLFTSSSIVRVEKIITRTNGNITLNSAFVNTPNLEHIIFEGGLANSMDFSSCSKLDYESLMSIINALVTITSNKTLKLGATNLAKLTDEEKAIATEKGWTLA
jgi:hypothetical protein